MSGAHPLLRLAVEQPQLLAQHASAYGALLAEEAAIAASGLQRHVAWRLAVGACLVVAAALAGVAVMLWATLPQAIEHAWVLVLVPAVPLLAAAAALLAARQRGAAAPFAALRQQAAADVALLQSTRVMASAP